MFWVSKKDVSCTRHVEGTSNWEDTQEQTQNMLSRGHGFGGYPILIHHHDTDSDKLL